MSVKSSGRNPAQMSQILKNSTPDYNDGSSERQRERERVLFFASAARVGIWRPSHGRHVAPSTVQAI